MHLYRRNPDPLANPALEDLYDFPEPIDAPWVQANFVASLDGAATLDGDSARLSSPVDQDMLALTRDLADAVLVGVTTAVVGKYQNLDVDPDRRRRHGLAPRPRLVVVTNRCSVAPDSPLVQDAPTPPIVVTGAAAPPSAVRDLVAAGAEVVVAGDETVDLRAALHRLGDRGLRRIACEGGPTLFGAMVAADLVDALCLTLSPTLSAGTDSRITVDPAAGVPRAMSLASVVADNEFLFLRYERDRETHHPQGRPADQPEGTSWPVVRTCRTPPSR